LSNELTLTWEEEEVARQSHDLDSRNDLEQKWPNEILQMGLLEIHPFGERKKKRNDKKERKKERMMIKPIPIGSREQHNSDYA